MPEVPQIVLDYAVEQFIDTIADLCDDPSWLEHPSEEPGYALHYLDRLRQLAVALQLDFDKVVLQHGSDFEVDRLLAIERRLRGTD